MPALLEIICGPMFAGKSTELIRRLNTARAAGQHAIAFKPAADTRSGRATIRTHRGETFDALPVAKPAHIIHLLPPTPDAAVGIDEAHFFGADLIAPVRALLKRGVRVIIAGIERDHRGRPFEPFPTLLCEADEVVKLASVCGVCGGVAVHTQRLVPSDAPIVVGGAETYQARCRNCFQAGD